MILLAHVLRHGKEKHSDFQFISIIRIVQLDTRIFIALISMCISAAMLNRHERYCVPRVQP